MKKSLFLLSALLLLSGFAPTSLEAAQWQPFEAKAFQEAQGAGKTIVVDIHASWCPTCKKQKKILDALLTYPEFKDVQTFVVDFDDQKEAVKTFKADSQSTILVFKGKKETDRSVGVTDQEALKITLTSGL